MGRAGDWFEQRSGIPGAWRRFFGEPLPRHVGWLHTLGSLLVILFAVQIVTGIVAAMHYEPGEATAYASVRYLDTQVVFGKLLRAMHHWGASFIVAVLGLHLLRVYWTASYKPPREFNWVVGVLLLVVTLGLAFTGYLLPWDLKAYWATEVGLNIATSMPLVGKLIGSALCGGEALGTLTLARFYAMHAIVLPAAVLLLVLLHLGLLRRHGAAPAPGVPEARRLEGARPFHPQQTARDALVALVVLVVLVVVSWRAGAPLTGEADPTDTAFVPRPEWYFLGLFQLLKIFKGPLEVAAALGVPALTVLGLLLLPFLDRGPERRGRRRPLATWGGAGVATAVLALTVVGAADRGPHRPPPVVAAVAGDPLALGRRLFTARKCILCHSIDGEGGDSAPDLSHVGRKVRRDFLPGWIRDPKSYHPDTEMIANPDILDADLDALIDFLAAHP